MYGGSVPSSSIVKVSQSAITCAPSVYMTRCNGSTIGISSSLGTPNPSPQGVDRGGCIGLYVLRGTRLSSTAPLPHHSDGVCISIDAIGASRHCTDRPDLNVARAGPRTGEHKVP